MTEEQDSMQEYIQRWKDASHAMQSGVMFEIELSKKKGQKEQSIEPKHLRVGINNALCDHTALINLLIEKGVFTKLEYVKAAALEMELEKKRYEDRINEVYSMDVTLK